MELDPGEEYDKLYRYCYFKLRHTQTAEDITQEAFLKFYSQSGGLHGGKPLAYLYTIAKNLCIDYYRKKKAPPLAETFSQAAGEMQMETVVAVRDAVRRLPEYLQELVLLRYVNDLKLGDIALITGQSRFALRRKLQSAMEQLKKQLKEVVE